jgi:hypothetical protein
LRWLPRRLPSAAQTNGVRSHEIHVTGVVRWAVRAAVPHTHFAGDPDLARNIAQRKAEFRRGALFFNIPPSIAPLRGRFPRQ